MRTCAFFSPSLHPVLERGKGHEDPVVSPEMPTRRAVGQAVLDHDAHRQIDHAVGIMTARWGQITEVGGKVCATLRTVMLRIRDAQITRTPQVEIAQVVVFQYYNEKSLAEISWQLCDEIVIDNPSVVVVAFIRNANRAVIQNEQHCICFTERGMCITRSRTPAGWHVTFREIL
jgi:hypothetical protein